MVRLPNRVIGAAVVGLLLSGLTLLGTATLLSPLRGDVDALAYGDGLLYRYAAENFDTPESDLDSVFVERGTSLRFGRIGLPALIWIASAGQRGAMPYAQAGLMVVAGMAASAGAAALFPRAGALAGALPFLAPGFSLAVSGGYAEAVAVACVIWALWAARRQNWWLCAGLLSLGTLCRENVLFVVTGILLLLLWKRTGMKPSIIVATSLIPVVTWYAVVAARYGTAPPFDPYLRGNGTVGDPIEALFNSLTQPASQVGLVMCVAHLAIWVATGVFLRRSGLGLITVVVGTQILISGPFAWRFAGDAARTSAFLQVLAIFALTQHVRPRWNREEHTLV